AGGQGCQARVRGGHSCLLEEWSAGIPEAVRARPPHLAAGRMRAPRLPLLLRSDQKLFRNSTQKEATPDARRGLYHASCRRKIQATAPNCTTSKSAKTAKSTAKSPALSIRGP